MAHTWWHVWGEIDKRHQKQWNTRDPDQNFYGVNDPRRAVRETTNRWSKKGSEVIDRIPEPVKEVVGGVTNVVGKGLFGYVDDKGKFQGGLLSSDANALGLQPVDALRAVDAGFETIAKVSGINRNVLDIADALLPFTPTAANLVKKGAKTVVRKSGAGALIDTATGQGMFAHAGTGLHKAGLKITPDKTGTIRFAKVNSDEGNALRLALLNRTKELLKENNIPISKYRQVRGKLSKEFPTEIGGEGREFSGIGKALRADDPSKISFPLAKTRARGKDQRSKVTAPPAKGDLNDLADDIGMPRDLIHDFIQDSQRTFANVRKAAARESAFPGEFHAGHLTAAASDVVPAYELYPRSRKTITSNIKDPTIPLEADTPGRMRYPPTAGEAATIELGVDNIRGSNKLVHNINPNVARWAGVPDTWAELMKSWWKRKQGKGTKDFFSDWNQTERDALMDIPYDMPRKEALKRFRKIEAMRNQRGDMGYKEIQKDLKLQLNEDDRFLDWQSSIGILGRSNKALYT